jgi:hypothetical protein
VLIEESLCKLVLHVFRQVGRNLLTQCFTCPRILALTEHVIINGAVPACVDAGAAVTAQQLSLRPASIWLHGTELLMHKPHGLSFNYPRTYERLNATEMRRRCVHSPLGCVITTCSSDGRKVASYAVPTQRS